MRLLRDGDESAVATMVAAGPGGPGEAAATRVVIAEDHAEMADVLRTYLEAVGYEVRVARDGVEAAAITAAFAPAVVVLDANMPGWSGWALLASWKGVPHEAPGGTRGEAAPALPSPAPAVVMLTGDDVFPAVARHAEAVLRKPAALRTIAAVVAQQVAARAG